MTTGEKLLLALSKNKETTLFAAPVEQSGASEPRFRLTITGPERLTVALLDYIFALGDSDD